LWLNGNRLGNAGAEALSRSPHLFRLVRLDLHSNNIGDRGARALLDSPYLPRSSRFSLVLSDNRISPSLRADLLERFGDQILE
jgi:hypothetical protein